MKKILIVEDSPIISKLLGPLLEEIFLELKLSKPSIKIVVTETEAIKTINSEKPDIITLDGNLTDNGHGINVLKRIDGENWGKIIVISNDESFLNFCEVNHILMIDKNGLSEEKLLPLVKKVLKLR